MKTVRFRFTPEKSFLFLWVLVLYAGSLLAQFSNLPTTSMFGVWGLLMAGLIVLSLPLVHRDNRLLRFYIFQLTALGLLFFLTFLILTFPPLMGKFTPESVYPVWHLTLALSYVLVARFYNKSELSIVGLLSLFSLAFYAIPSLHGMYPLVFGLVHAPALLVIGVLFND